MRLVDRLIVSRTEEAVHIRCPAKVNFFLKVLGKRGDGYHEVQNVMQTVTLFDELKVRRQNAGVTLACSGEDIEGDAEENLAFRAVELFLKRGHGSGGIHLELRKNIPVTAGLGGGSSDASCSLLALNELFHAGLSADDLRSLAAELGSDAPFFVEGGTALCTGRGEIVRLLPPSPRFAGILACPKASLTTPEMYGLLQSQDAEGPDLDLVLRSIERGDLTKTCSVLFNSFERAAFQKVPELPRLKKKLEELGSIGVVLCGKGPSLLGIFLTPEEAERGLRRLTRSQELETRFAVVVSAL